QLLALQLPSALRCQPLPSARLRSCSALPWSCRSRWTWLIGERAADSGSEGSCWQSLHAVGPVACRRVLELGAGFCGLPSRIAARTGASHALATDGVAEVLQQLERNVAGCGVEACT
ncbi:unnamed protein product, partial [Polarella glacialis]